MTTPPVPYRFEYELVVPGTPDDIWPAIASAEGISAWMMPTDLEPRVGGAVEFHMGPDASSRGQVTAFEPGRRIVYEEDWATLVGHAGADVTPLAAFDHEGGSGLHLLAYLFSADAPAYAEREQSAWQAWLDGTVAGVAEDRSSA